MKYSSTPFSALMVATFSGAFLDLSLKTGVLFVPGAFSSAPSSPVTLFVLLALLPTVPAPLAALYGGYVADTIGKPALIRIIKILELGLAVGCALALLRDNFFAAYLMVFLLGSTGAIFTTAKFAILPGMFPTHKLPSANGRIIAAKYSAMVAGLLAATFLMLVRADVRLVLASLFFSVAAVGCIASFFIKEDPSYLSTPAHRPVNFNAFRTNWSEIRASKHLFLSMLSFAYILIIGAVFQFNTSIFLQEGGGFTQTRMGILFGLLSMGIAFGGIIAGRVSRSKVEIGLVPIGALGVGVFLLLSAAAIQSFTWLYALYLASGISGGLCVVPLYALFQQNTPSDRRGAFLGISQAVSNLGLLLMLLAVLLLQSIAASYPSVIFTVTGILTIGVSIYALSHTPIALIRCMNWVFANFVYRIRVFGLENVPEKGGALIVCNHISYFDPLLVSASVQRTVRFLIRRQLFSHSILKHVLRIMKAIPVSTSDAPKALMRSLQEAREALLRGEIVCVFAEGEPARVGHMLPFTRGIEVIMKGVNVPVIPVYLDQTWGSLFDFVDGKYRLKVPQELPYPATLTYGRHLPSDTSVFEIRQTISELGSAAFLNRRREQQFVHLAFMKEARRRPFHTCMVESSGKRVTNLKALIGSFVLARKFSGMLNRNNKCVGVLLPPCIGSALTNMALLLKGFIPVNLNYTASREASVSTVSQARISQVITSSLFLSKIEKPEGVEFIFLDELVPRVSKVERILAMLTAVFVPFAVFKWQLLRDGVSSQDQLATIIFSSGSTGIPKGVMLSHANIASNVESMFNALSIRRSDALLGVLPFFHAFGLTTGLWLPLMGGVKVLFHFTPLDAETIGELVFREKGTIVLSTPTFLMSYIRRIPKEHFSSVRWTVVGAEKLRSRIAQAYNEKFGSVPLEGYGCTELSPVAMINLPDIKEPTRDQIGNKPGTVGHPIPGVAVRIVDPDSRAPLGPDQMGLLLVKGPNVMKGYLNQPEKTAEVIWDGWYSTGDLATLDKDGFVTLHDRLSRFSKIAGEMVPHGAVEDAIQRALSEVDPMCVVTSVADERRGERLIVLHTKDLDARNVIRILNDQGLPNLWVPRSEDFHRIEQIPVLGSGKLDLQGVKKLAEKMSSV